MFSKSCEYAIKIMIFLSKKGQEGAGKVGLEEIASSINSPKAFTAKILQQLVRAKLLESIPGRNGGFSTVKNREVSLEEIVRAIDGEKLLNGCVLGFHDCSETHPCPVHYKFKGIRDYLSGILTTTSIEEVTKLMKENKVFLK